MAPDWIPDGVKVAANGVVLTAAGPGIDVLDAAGNILVRIQTNFTVQNLAFSGRDLKWVPTPPPKKKNYGFCSGRGAD